jgi:carbon monoxide dehydrogenase subunit G
VLVESSFTVPVPVDQAWATLLDVPRIAACLPGAGLEESVGTTHRGRVTVKVGPIQLAFRGEATIAEQDETARRLVLVATGKETRGSGAASARGVADLVERDGATEVQVATELELTGKPAQFGRSIISEVSGRLIDQFATNLAVLMVEPQAPSTPAAVPVGAPGLLPAPAPPPAAATPAGGAALDVWALVPVPVRVALRVALPAILLVGLRRLLRRRAR